jgi:DNA mismatch repair ATPase MutS
MNYYVLIHLLSGRHPLQSLCVDNFVPNDTYISKDKNIALITGPNSSGNDT